MVPARGDARRRPLGMRRWLLGTATLALTLGVVVMHSLGVGHHGSAFMHHDSTSTHHAGTVASGAPALARQSGHGSGERVSHHGALSGHVSTAFGGAAGVALSLAGSEPGPGAMAMCLAVLPLLLLSRRRGGGASSGGALRHTPRPPAAVPASWFCRPPGGSGPSLSKLCILRT